MSSRSEPGPVRRAPAPVPGLHRLGLQPAPDQPGRGARSGPATRPRRRRSGPNYLATDEDRRVAVDAIRLTRRIAAAPALARFAPEEYRPGAAGCRARPSWSTPPATSAPRSSTRSAPAGWGRTAMPRPWSTRSLRVRGIDGPARRRRLDHAHDHLGQHQRAGDHDRREGGRHDRGGRKGSRPRGLRSLASVGRRTRLAVVRN